MIFFFDEKVEPKKSGLYLYRLTDPASFGFNIISFKRDVSSDGWCEIGTRRMFRFSKVTGSFHWMLIISENVNGVCTSATTSRSWKPRWRLS